MVDLDDDLKIGVKSTAILFGSRDREIIGGLQLAMLGILAAVGVQAGLGIGYALGLAGGAGFFIYQQWLIRNREKPLCFRAFLNNHWFGAAVFAGLALDYLWR
jgi:4-hydroxybenzoate polyprenyltransferase